MHYEASSYGWDIFYIIRNLLIYSQQLWRQSCGGGGRVTVQFWYLWNLVRFANIWGKKTSQESMVDVPRERQFAAISKAYISFQDLYCMKVPSKFSEKQQPCTEMRAFILKPRLNYIPQSFLRRREALTLDDGALGLKCIAYLAVNRPVPSPRDLREDWRQRSSKWVFPNSLVHLYTVQEVESFCAYCALNTVLIV